MIKLSDAKPVVSLQKREYRSGDTVNLVRVGRPAGFNYPLPCYLERGEERQLLASCDKGAQFSKLLTGDKQFRSQLLLRDRKELCRALRDSLSDVIFVQKALDLIDRELGETQVSDKPLLDTPADSATNVYAEHSQDLLDELNYSEGGEEIDTSEEIPQSSKQSIEDWVYHYQLADGQYTFLDPLNAAMLREEYGLLTKSPQRIRDRIVSITRHVVSEQLRHKYKWLSHLPLMCEVQFCEVNLRPPLVSHNVMDMFKETVEKRRINRHIKQKQEEISEKKAAAYWSKAYPSLLQAESENLPDLSSESFTPLPSTGSSCITEHVPLSSSFAQALSHQYVPPKPAPVPAVPETSAPTEPLLQRSRLSSESDEDFAPPTYRESMSDAIAAKLDAYLLQKDMEAVPKSKIPCGPRGKRGKGKKIVLFSTSAGRPN